MIFEEVWPYFQRATLMKTHCAVRRSLVFKIEITDFLKIKKFTSQCRLKRVIIFKIQNDLFKKKKSAFNREHRKPLFYVRVKFVSQRCTSQQKWNQNLIKRIGISYLCLTEWSEAAAIWMTTMRGGDHSSFYENWRDRRNWGFALI